ncbi:hypothetical protein [Streptomyces iranensis]|uniref:hypothetical protein n=1 Tax=Streptomyces iranensis TaxID=576784 RepID=UPI0039B76072
MGARNGVEVLVGGLGGVGVVVQEALGGLGSGVGGVVGGEGVGVFAQQVVEAVAVGGGFFDEVVDVEGFQVASCLGQGDVGEGGGGVGVDVGAGVEAEVAEEVLEVGWEVLVGEVEGGGDGAVAGFQFAQAVLCGGEFVGEGGEVPGGAMGQASCEQGDREGEVAA